nr:MAG TPA: hypothetical protein [Caudoviricetes sp.]
MGVYLVWESSQKGDYRVYSNLEQAAMRAEELNGNGRLPSMGIVAERRLPGLLESRTGRYAGRGA